MLDKEAHHPLILQGEVLKSVVYLKHFITKEHIHIGDYTYYHARHAPEEFEKNNILYDGEGLGLQLEIGKFCQIATNTKFLCPYSEHHIHSLTTYPFYWKDHETTTTIPDRSHFDHDVWFGYDSLIMPGVHIGSGAIIATRAVVTKDVSPYAIVGGNPAKIIRMRFNEATIQRLLTLAWWHWPIDIIEANYQALLTSDLDYLETIKWKKDKLS